LINHVIQHQNSYVYSYLFKDNLIDIMEKGIEVAPLFNSEVFIYNFDL